MQEDMTSAVEHSAETGLGIVFKVQKPDDAVVETWQDCVISGNYLEYTIVADDLNVGETYLITPKFALGAWEGEGDTCSMYVYDEFETD